MSDEGWRWWHSRLEAVAARIYGTRYDSQFFGSELESLFVDLNLLGKQDLLVGRLHDTGTTSYSH